MIGAVRALHYSTLHLRNATILGVPVVQLRLHISQHDSPELVRLRLYELNDKNFTLMPPGPDSVLEKDEMKYFQQTLEAYAAAAFAQNSRLRLRIPTARTDTRTDCPSRRAAASAVAPKQPPMPKGPRRWTNAKDRVRPPARRTRSANASTLCSRLTSTPSLSRSPSLSATKVARTKLRDV